MATLRTVTVKTSGGTYTTLSGAEAGEQGDLTSLDRQLDIVCSAMTDTTNVTFAGWATDATRYIRVLAAENHGGNWNTGAYVLATTTANKNAVSIANGAGARIDIAFVGLQIDQQAGDSVNCTGISGGYSYAVDVDRCIIRSTASSPVGSIPGIKFNTAATETAGLAHRIRNTVVYDFTGTQIDTKVYAGTNVLYNNTTYGGSGGIFISKTADGDASTVYWTNNIVQAASGDDFHKYNTGWTETALTNLSSDATAPGTGYVRSTTLTFTNLVGRNFHLAAADTGAIGAGTDLSADGAWATTLDIDGLTRVAPWDIGADQRGIKPTAGSVVLTASAPTVEIAATGISVTPTTGALSLTGAAPLVYASISARPGTASLTLTADAPLVENPRAVQPAVGNLTLTGAAPTVGASRSAQPGTASVLLTADAPVVIASLAGIVEPQTGALTLTAAAPVVERTTWQYAVPASDVDAGAWLPSTGALLWDCIDEIPAGDGDYIYATNSAVCTVGLGAVGAPTAGTVTLRVRALQAA